jgi:2-succinyl-5-enolpyruvyl-6-hydroxy-3-cyclohexene-1-carboxylate synthase
MVADHPWRYDPNHRVTLRIESDVTRFCKMLVERVKKRTEAAWLDGFVGRSQIVEQTLKETIDDNDALTEPAVARLISQNIQRDFGLFVANSMPIRDMDMYADPRGPMVTVACNRGASGIDGIIASATGFTCGLNKPVTLLIGDLAFLHDVNSLALLKSLAHPLIVVVINNDGGGLFSFLPIAQVNEVFEPFFGTPHGLSFEHAAGMFGVDYCRLESKEAFVAAYVSAQGKRCSSIIEVETDRGENYEIHREIEERVGS